MIKVSVLYPQTEGMRFDMAYYVDKHMGMVKRVLGDALDHFEIDEGLSGAAPGSQPTPCGVESISGSSRGNDARGRRGWAGS